MFNRSKIPTRLFIGDSHFPYHNINMFDFLTGIKYKYNITEIFFLGDLVDQHTLSRHDFDPDLPSTGDELEKAKESIQKLVKLFPNVNMVTGNHDNRILKRAKKSGISSKFIKSLHDVYKLPTTWIVKDKVIINTYYGLTILIHGDSFSGVNASNKWFNKYQKNTIIGHCHDSANIRWYQIDNQKKFAAIAPCLADQNSLAMEYSKGYGGQCICGCILMQEDRVWYEFF